MRKLYTLTQATPSLPFDDEEDDDVEAPLLLPLSNGDFSFCAVAFLASQKATLENKTFALVALLLLVKTSAAAGANG